MSGLRGENSQRSCIAEKYMSSQGYNKCVKPTRLARSIRKMLRTLLAAYAHP
jgi:hypothetical protein